MKYPKATMRKNGHKMMTTSIPLHVGKDEVEQVLIDALCLADNKVQFLVLLKKAALWERVVSTYAARGINWFPEGPDVEEVRAEFGTAIAEAINTLFPELN